VGVDFLDNEAKFPALEAGQLLYGEVLRRDLAGELNLCRTMHAGEIGDPRNPRDPMIMGAERLGHGVNLAKAPVALEYAAKVHEPVEINLSSNLRLTSAASVEEHPFLGYLRLGLPVSLSTDDEGVFDTDIDHECELAVGRTDLAYSEFKRMAFNSIETSFASETDKKALLADLPPGSRLSKRPTVTNPGVKK
jgi:adenosine deaminase